MNSLSTACQQGGGGLKENPPCTPLKENKGRRLLFSVPVPVPIARTHAPAQGTPPDGRTGTGTVCLRNSGTGTGTAQGHRPTVNAELILHGYNAQGTRYDAVQTALYALGIPLESNGRNNASILRWHLRRIGEENFRQIVYEQWRENQIDGAPRNVVAALTVKLFKAGGDAR